MYMMCMYYSIVHTRHIHGSDMYIHVYARWVGFQMPSQAMISYAYDIILFKLPVLYEIASKLCMILMTL